MAEALFNAAPPSGWRARSAGTEPGAKVRAEAIAVMAELGLDISRQVPKGLTVALGADVALVVGLCEEEACPVIPGARSLHWPMPVPRSGDHGHYRHIRDALRERIAALATDLQQEPHSRTPAEDP